MRVLCVYRDERYSPNSVEKDKAILDAVGEQLRGKGYDVTYTHERDLKEVKADCCLSMARSANALAVLQEHEGKCLNAPEGVALCCHRSALDQLMREHAVPMPPLESTEGYWLKRGDGPAEQKDDVVFCRDEAALRDAQRQMSSRGIDEQVVSVHVRGDLVKFYGVSGTGFFRCYYPADDGISKFGDEAQNGAAHHYAYDAALLKREAERLAALVHVDIYGGDCIVSEEGTLAIIDFNDWPSFSRCREEAAEVIALRLMRLMQQSEDMV